MSEEKAKKEKEKKSEEKKFSRKQAKKEMLETFGLKEEGYFIMSRRGQIEEFWKNHPFYYDDSRLFWLWNKEKFKWIASDEVNFCNLISKKIGVNTLDAKTRGEIIEGLKEVGRDHKPKDMKKTWVQFLNKIYDVATGEEFDASPEYFIANPIPFKLGESEETPTINKLFDDWMQGQDPSWKQTLYEIMAYNLSQDKFMQRIIALVGGGSNGKGTFIKLNYRFLGEENCVASEVKALSEDKFEPFVLYKKLLCVMGEVSYDDLKNTNMLKKLGGEDKISFQKKGHTPFTEENTATCICLTNSMPITPDKTQGFYRKWLIIDFINQFKIIDKNILNSIPTEEFENLARKLLKILVKLYRNQHFTNEGDFEERAKRYEERSNPVMKFIDDRCEEVEGCMTPVRDFTISCNSYLKERHLRILSSKQIGKVLREEGFVVGNRKIDDISSVVITNLKIQNNKVTEITKKLNNFFDESSIQKDSGNDDYGNFSEEELNQTGWTKEKLKDFLEK